MKRKRKAKRETGREMPEAIPDTPENVAKAILSSPPKPESEWEYLKTRKEGQK